MWDFTPILCSHHWHFQCAFFSNSLILTLYTNSLTVCFFGKNIIHCSNFEIDHIFALKECFTSEPWLSWSTWALVYSASIVIHSHPHIYNLLMLFYACVILLKKMSTFFQLFLKTLPTCPCVHWKLLVAIILLSILAVKRSLPNVTSV